MRRAIGNITLATMMASLAALGVAACGGADGDPTTGGGFENRDDATGETRVVGRAVTPEGEAAADVVVFVRTESGDKVRGRTDTEGRFDLEGAPTGRATVVLNDGEGLGGMRELELLADGENRVGEIELEPITDLPELVKVPGVGYEHRVTDTRGDYHFPEYSSDRSTVYAARRLDGKEKWDVVAIDTESGRERVLAEGYDLDTFQASYDADPEEPQRRVFRLVEDRYLMWSYDTEDSGTWRVVYDVQEGEVVFDSQDVGATLMKRTAVMEERTVMPLAVERENVSGRRLQSVHKVKFFVLDHDEAEVTEGPWAGDGDTWFWFFGIDDTADGSFVYRAEPACGSEGEGFERCQRFRGAGRVPFYIFDSEELSTSALGEPVELTNARARLLASGDEAYVIGSDVSGSDWTPTLRRYDVDSGGSTTFTLDVKGDDRAPDVRVGADAQDIYLAWPKEIDDGIEHPDLPGYEFASWSDGETTTSTPTVELDGTEKTLCSSGPCHVYWDDPETLRIRAMFERGDGDWWAALVDYRDGEIADRRVFDILENDEGPADRWTSHPESRTETDVARAADAGVEAMRLRRGTNQTGFFQLFVRQDPEDPQGFEQRTFLRSDHWHPALNADGSTVYYFTKDPLSGYVQLFRYDTAALPAPN